MTNPTSNFGWQMPTPTDLVTNLPADFEVFGQAVDSDFADLLGGTTGQVLKKNTNADLDFVWSADAAGMTNPMTTTGDTIYSSPGSTPARLGIGSTGQVLTVAAGVPSWATPAGGGGGKVLQVVSATTSTRVDVSSTTYTDSGLTVSITPTLSTSKILILVTQPVYVSGSGSINANIRIVRGSTAIFNDVTGGTNGSLSNSSAGEVEWIVSSSYLDNPATTSSTTYKTQGVLKTSGGGNGLSFQVRSGEQGTITLLEIGA
jgi:hypothetical protein